jgi:hypothetical protein
MKTTIFVSSCVLYNLDILDATFGNEAGAGRSRSGMIAIA